MKKLRLLTLIFCIITACYVSFSSAPQWWEERGVVESVEGENSEQVRAKNYEAANVGQLMYIAKRAAEELNEKAEGGAGEAVNSMVASFPTYNAANPDANYAVLNIGQLKNVAKPFYDRLWELSAANEGSVNFPSSMVFVSGGTESGNHKYPWAAMPDNPSESDYAINYEIANIGQVKNLFSWSINDVEEIFEDTDGDGIPDLWEYEFFGDLESVDENSDTDGDGLKDVEELALGTNPFSWDSDGDGVGDSDELEIGTDPDNPDSDGDGFLDGDEILYGFDPLVYNDNEPDDDTDNDGIPNAVELFYNLNLLDSSDASGDLDGDGLTNLQEYQLGTRIDDPDTDGDGILDAYDDDPFHAPANSPDSDGDGMPNSWEIKYGLNPNDASDASIDSDYDGLTNLQEYQLGLNPKNPDTDYDGLNDGWEYRNMYSQRSVVDGGASVVFSPKHWNYSKLDTDGDGFTDAEESVYDTNPRLVDSDNDGASDYEEVLGGRDPKDSSDANEPLDYNSMVEVEMYGGCICNSPWNRCSWLFSLGGKVLLTSSVYDPLYTYHVDASLKVYLKKGAVYEGTYTYISGTSSGGLLWDCSTFNWSVFARSVSESTGVYYHVEHDNSYTGIGGSFHPSAGEKYFNFNLHILDPKIVSITFDSPMSYKLKKDDGSGYVIPSDTTPHYTQDKSYPAIFETGKKAKISSVTVDFGIDLPLSLLYNFGWLNLELYLGRNNSDHYKFRSSVSNGSRVATFTNLEQIDEKDEHLTSESSIPDKIDYREYINPTIVLKSSAISGTPTWSNGAGGELYVIKASEGERSEGYYTNFYETVVHTACVGAKGKIEFADIVNGIWKMFSKPSPNAVPSFKNKRGEPLYYYNDNYTRFIEVSELLKYKDGQCVAWTKLLLECFKIQETNKTYKYVTMGWTSVVDPQMGIMIKTWTFNDEGKSDDPEYPYINVFDENGASFEYEDAHYDKYLPGQNNPKPPYLFSNHQFALVCMDDGSSLYLDPSYGELLQTRTSSFSGIYRRVLNKRVSKEFYNLKGSDVPDQNGYVRRDVMYFKKLVKELPYDEVNY